MPGNSIRFGDLSPKWQDLFRRMQRNNFGYFKNLRISEGEPELHDDFECFSLHRFPGDNSPRPETSLDDFVLPKEMSAFYRALIGEYFVKIKVVQFRHGLPFTMEVEDIE